LAVERPPPGCLDVSRITELYTDYLPSGKSGLGPLRNQAPFLVLIHEMVHHLQKHAQLRYDCPQEREKLAYQAQERWLTRVGATLQSEFEIDPMTLFLHSACLPLNPRGINQA
jgi:hypothetical protein